MSEKERQQRDKITDQKWVDYLKKFTGYDQDAEDAYDASNISDRTMYIDKDDYEFFVNMRAKKSFMKYGGVVLQYIFVLVFGYFIYCHVMSMTSDSDYERPSWGLFYIPMVSIVFFKMFNNLSLVKMSF